MMFNPLSGKVTLDKNEIEIIACAVRSRGGFLRTKEMNDLRHGLWNEELRVECIPAVTRVLRLWNVDAHYKYAIKMVEELEELLTHVPEWEENLRKKLEREKNVSNQQLGWDT